MNDRLVIDGHWVTSYLTQRHPLTRGADKRYLINKQRRSRLHPLSTPVPVHLTMTTKNPLPPPRHHRHRRSQRRRRPRSSDTAAANDGGSVNNANKIIVIGLVAFCFINILDLDILVNTSGGGRSTTGRRRSLLSTLYLAGPSTLLPWAHHHLVDVTDRPDPTAKNALFWRE